MTKTVQSAVRYRLHTEQAANLAQLVLEAGIKSFSIIPCTGYWQGGQEMGACVEILSTGNDAQRIEDLANSIRIVNQQDAVYIVTETVLLTIVNP